MPRFQPPQPWVYACWLPCRRPRRLRMLPLDQLWCHTWTHQALTDRRARRLSPELSSPTNVCFEVKPPGRHACMLVQGTSPPAECQRGGRDLGGRWSVTSQQSSRPLLLLLLLLTFPAMQPYYISLTGALHNTNHQRPARQSAARISVQAAPAAAHAAQGRPLRPARSAPAARSRGRAGCSSGAAGKGGSCAGGGQLLRVGECLQPGKGSSWRLFQVAQEYGAGPVPGGGPSAPPPCPPEERLEGLQVLLRGEERLAVADWQARPASALQGCAPAARAGEWAERGAVQCWVGPSWAGRLAVHVTHGQGTRRLHAPVGRPAWPPATRAPPALWPCTKSARWAQG